MATINLGKWSDPGVPHKGWECIDVEELGELTTCEMCEMAEIRYGHSMEHPDYPDTLVVGCVCAEHMEQDYVTPRLREDKVKNRGAVRRRWLQKEWKRSQKGNSFLKARGFHVVIWKNSDATWGGVVTDLVHERKLFSERRHVSEEAAKLASLDAIKELKEQRVR